MWLTVEEVARSDGIGCKDFLEDPRNNGENKVYESYSEDSVSYASSNGHTKLLDEVSSSSMMSVYCGCGRIVNQDRSEMKLKLDLGKELECTTCRNTRISHEIDELNQHFEPVQEESDEVL